MKNILLTILLLICVALIFLASKSTVFGFEHDQRMSSNIITENWAFSKKEIKDILIEHLESKGWKVLGKESASVFLNCDYNSSKAVDLWVEYDITADVMAISLSADDIKKIEIDGVPALVCGNYTVILTDDAPCRKETTEEPKAGRFAY